ncbi:MAG: RNA polymerase sigma factor [Myxococcales bacterium]|nr:RNA polymerase sigma factor [Myxococcales bacterium]
MTASPELSGAALGPSVVSRGPARRRPARRKISPAECPRAASVRDGAAVARAAPIDELARRRRLAQLTRDHQAFLGGLARKLCRSNFDPEDLVQDVLLKAVAHYDHDRLRDGANPAAWLARVMRNLFIDRVRARAARPAQVRFDGSQVAVGIEHVAWWETVTADDVRAVLPQLPAELRAAFERFAFQRQSYREIAAALDVPVATVGTRVLRARRRINALLRSGDARWA